MTNPRINDKSGELFNNIMRRHKFKRDAELARFIETPPYYVCEVRNGKREIGDKVLLRICELAGISVKNARAQIAKVS